MPPVWAKAGMEKRRRLLHDSFKASALLSGYDIPYEGRKHKCSIDWAYTNQGIKALVFLNYAIRISKVKNTFALVDI